MYNDLNNSSSCTANHILSLKPDYMSPKSFSIYVCIFKLGNNTSSKARSILLHSATKSIDNIWCCIYWGITTTTVHHYRTAEVPLAYHFKINSEKRQIVVVVESAQ